MDAGGTETALTEPIPTPEDHSPAADSPEGVVEWVDSDGVAEPEAAGRWLDPTATWRRLRMVFSNDEGAFVGLDDREVIGGSAVAVVSILAGAIGGWLYVAIRGHESLSITRVILGSVLLGTLVATAAWAGWIFIVRWWMLRHGHHVDELHLVAAMGYATAPFGLSLLMATVVPAYGVALVAMVWWYAATAQAIRATVPDAPPGRITKANLAGFASFSLVLSFLAFTAGIAPGPFVLGM